MIIYTIVSLFDSLLAVLMSSMPTIETPLWISNNLPAILTKIATFNYYLPIQEMVMVVSGVIGITIAWWLIKVVLSLFIDLD